MVNNHITGLGFYPILDRIIDQYGKFLSPQNHQTKWKLSFKAIVVISLILEQAYMSKCNYKVLMHAYSCM